MNILTNRQRQLINILLKSAESLSKEYLSMKLNVSSRTILNDIKAINTSQVKDIQILTKRGSGYYIKTKALDIGFELNQNLDDFNDSHIRVKKVVRYLIEAKDYIKTQELSDRMFVSKQTISNDMKLVKSLLKNYHLQLVSRPSYGIQIEGSEDNKRKCYIDCLTLRNYTNLFQMTEYEKELFSPLQIDDIFKIVSLHIKKSHFIPLEGIEKILTIHIAISVLRIEKHIHFDFNVLKNLKNYTEEIVFTKALLDDVGHGLNIIFPQDEVNYIAMHFVCLTKSSQGRYSQDFRSLLNFLTTNYGRTYCHNKEFIDALLAHLNAFERRAKFNVWAKNPLLDDIKRKYFFYFEMALAFLRAFYSDMDDIDEGEIGLLALHFASADYQESDHHAIKVIVVCAAGKCSGRLIEKQLLTHMTKDIKHVEVLTYKEYVDKEVLDGDLVLTSIHIESRGVPIVKISSLPEINELQEVISVERIAIERNESVIDPLIFDHLFFQIDHYGLTSKDDVIDYMGHQLCHLGFVGETFIQSVKKREDISSTCIMPSIAIPHSLDNNVKKPCIAIGISQQGIMWGEEKVHLIFMVNADERHIRALDCFYNSIISLMDSYECIEGLLHCRSMKEFMNKLMYKRNCISQ